MRATTVLATLLAAIAARAQEWDMGPMSMYAGSTAIEYESLHRSRLMGVPVVRKGAAATRLAFRRDPAVSARVRKGLVGPLARKDAKAGARLDRMLADGSLYRNFDTMMRPYGFRSDDAADAVAAFWIMDYLIANDVAKDPPAIQARAVRAQVASRLAAQPAMRDNPARQALGESLVARFIVMDALRSQALKVNDTALRKRLADQARTAGRMVLGVDVAKVRLTDAGFMPKG